MSNLDRSVLATTLLCMALVGFFIVWSNGQNDMPGTGSEASAASPLYALFSALDEDGMEQLFLLSVDPVSPATPDPQQITDLPTGIWDFSVASTAPIIYFSVLKPDGTGELWQYTVGDPAPKILIACAEGPCSNPAAGPSDAFMAFTQRVVNDFSSPMTSPPRLRLLSMQERSIYPVFADSQKLGLEPHWSHDGLWLSFVSPDPPGVGAYQLESGEERLFASTTGESGVWRPGGSQLIFSDMLQTGDLYETHLYRYDVVSEESVDLSLHEFPVEDNNGVWSPDGQWLALRRKELDGPRAGLGKQLWLMRADGSDARPLTHDIGPENEIDYGAPVWSPDGRYLLYHRFPLRGPDITISVWLMDVEAGEQRLLAAPGQRPLWVQ
ncbi:MAG: PD40 domain-containing protein [Caldilineaceae bacterium]|nr:PD40 domain-containing protein [Caldilineaceae bacterium]